MSRKAKDDVNLLDLTPVRVAEWIEDKDSGLGVFKSKLPTKTQRTEKSLRVIELSPATKEHKAQVTTENQNVVIGEWSTRHLSGRVTPARKSELLGKIDQLLRAVKKARMRANSTQVVKVNIGKDILSFINDFEP